MSKIHRRANTTSMLIILLCNRIFEKLNTDVFATCFQMVYEKRNAHGREAETEAEGEGMCMKTKHCKILTFRESC